jgi:predicted AAA+ superfamily ATPase
MNYWLKQDKQTWAWTDSFIRSYIERDLEFLLGVNLSSSIIQKLWNMLAYVNGGIRNAEVFARSLGITAPTVLRYVDYLEGAYLIRRLQPWYMNASKRLVKSPKVYIRDSGILHSLLRLSSIDDILSHPAAGASWEGYVVEQIYQFKDRSINMYFYRTHDGAECDVVLVRGVQPLTCLEIKLTNAPSISKGFYTSAVGLKVNNKIVITPSSEEYVSKDNVVVTSLYKFLKEHLPLIK